MNWGWFGSNSWGTQLQIPPHNKIYIVQYFKYNATAGDNSKCYGIFWHEETKVENYPNWNIVSLKLFMPA